MNKTQLLDDIKARVLRVIEVVKEPDPVKEAAGINTYYANVLNLNRGKAQGQTIAFYVIDEGKPTENAVYKDEAGVPVSLEQEAIAFIKTLPYVKVIVDDINVETETAIARAYADNADGTVTEKKIILYKDANGVSQYREIV